MVVSCWTGLIGWWNQWWNDLWNDLSNHRPREKPKPKRPIQIIIEPDAPIPIPVEDWTIV